MYAYILGWMDGWMDKTNPVSQPIPNFFLFGWWNKFTNFQIQCVLQDNPKRSSHIWWAYHFPPIHIGGMYFESFVRRGTFGPDVFLREIQKIYSCIIRVYLTVIPRWILNSFILKSLLICPPLEKMSVNMNLNTNLMEKKKTRRN